MKPVELGIFLPIGNNGYMISKTAPQYRPTYALNAAIAEQAEQQGFSYVFSMSKWRGYGGDTEFWDHTLDSVSLTAALCARTERIRVYGTFNPLLYNPVVAAKCIATMDDISQGRLAINIVTGVSLEEYAQMGVVPDCYNEFRYQLAEEWLELVKRLWQGEVVSDDGRFFRLRDVRSSPPPVQRPHPPVVCAGISDEGFAFTARHADIGFFAGRTIEETVALSARMKEFGRRQGRSVRTATPILVITGESDEASEARHESIRRGVDEGAVRNIVGLFGDRAVRPSDQARLDRILASAAFGLMVIKGSPETVARRLAKLAAPPAGVDSILLVFCDYLADMSFFSRRICPLLPSFGITAGVQSDAGAVKIKLA